MNVAAHLFYDAGDLMSLGNGIAGEWVLSVIYMDIRSADADPHDADQYIAAADRGDIDLPEFDRPGTCHNLLEHIVLPPSGVQGSTTTLMESSAICRRMAASVCSTG